MVENKYGIALDKEDFKTDLRFLPESTWETERYGTQDLFIDFLMQMFAFGKLYATTKNAEERVQYSFNKKLYKSKNNRMSFKMLEMAESQYFSGLMEGQFEEAKQFKD